MAWTLTNNSQGSSAGSSVNAIAATAFTSPLTVGSIILVMCEQLSAASGFSVTDTAGNTYVDCGGGKLLWDGSAASNQLFFAINRFTTASNIVTAHSTATAAHFAVNATEFTGNAGSNALDGFAQSAANATTSGTGADNMFTSSITTTQDGDLIYCAMINNNGTVTPGTNFTVILVSGNIGSEYLVQNTRGSISGTWDNNTSSDGYACQMVAVKQHLIYMLGHT